jgi:hypothetical protein
MEGPILKSEDYNNNNKGIWGIFLDPKTGKMVMKEKHNNTNYLLTEPTIFLTKTIGWLPYKSNKIWKILPKKIYNHYKKPKKLNKNTQKNKKR